MPSEPSNAERVSRGMETLRIYERHSSGSPLDDATDALADLFHALREDYAGTQSPFTADDADRICRNALRHFQGESSNA